MSTEETLSQIKREAFSGDLAKVSTQTLNEYAAAHRCAARALALLAVNMEVL